MERSESKTRFIFPTDADVVRFNDVNDVDDVDDDNDDVFLSHRESKVLVLEKVRKSPSQRISSLNNFFRTESKNASPDKTYKKLAPQLEKGVEDQLQAPANQKARAQKQAPKKASGRQLSFARRPRKPSYRAQASALVLAADCLACLFCWCS